MMKYFDKFNLKIQYDSSFEPNLTTKLITEAALSLIKSEYKNNLNVLELGCGCGIISLAIKKSFLKDKNIHFNLSDLAEGAIFDAKKNFSENNVIGDIRHGSMFLPWGADNFDIIINDISGISKRIAHLSPWFSKADMSSGDDGTELLVEFLNKVKLYMNRDAKILFPILSLSRSKDALELSRTLFDIRMINSRDWPLPVDMVNNPDFFKICDELTIPISSKGGVYYATTTVYEGRSE